MTLRDEDTIQELLNGEDEAWSAVRAWVGKVINASRFGPALRDHQEDLTQQVLMKVLASLRADKFAGRASLKTYIYEIAKNTCIDQIREKYRKQRGSSIEDLNCELASADENPYGHLLQMERHQRLAEAMRHAAPACRKLWVMIFQEKFSYREIAAQMDTTEGAVKQNVFRCNRRLMDWLKPAGVKKEGP
ncbi:MAG: sigma-70 family RNA polymerase sigma factor [Acidobacteria bacterium]|nr:sigma-70 family RNA polymerase sigma factor [Acidobacteriota bacterium]